MEAEISSVIERVTVRLSILHDLVDAFLRAQSAIGLFDLQNMEAHIARQRQLCHVLMALNDSVSEQSPPDAGRDALKRWHTLSRELKQTELHVLHLGRVQAALLRRTRRGLDLFSRLLASTALTYTPAMIAGTPDAGK